jgi:hypothetical protein
MRILPGLPPYGPTAVPFPASGRGAHRVGFVVEIDDGRGGKWVGNFQRAATTFDAAFETFGTDRPVIIAGGEGYLVDAPTHAELATFAGHIIWAHELPKIGRLILADDLRFYAVEREGLVWQSRRVSWDGMGNIVVRDGTIHGDAFSPMDDGHHPFEIDLATGAETGGSYSEDWEVASANPPRKGRFTFLKVATLAIPVLAASVIAVIVAMGLFERSAAWWPEALTFTYERN